MPDETTRLQSIIEQIKKLLAELEDLGAYSITGPRRLGTEIHENGAWPEKPKPKYRGVPDEL